MVVTWAISRELHNIPGYRPCIQEVLYVIQLLLVFLLLISFITSWGKGLRLEPKRIKGNSFPPLDRKGKKRKNETRLFVHLPLLYSRQTPDLSWSITLSSWIAVYQVSLFGCELTSCPRQKQLREKSFCKSHS